MSAIYRREMGAFFTSGIAYVFLTVFWLVSGIFFFTGTIMSNTTNVASMFSSMFYVVMCLIPILTMKLLSEEKKNKGSAAYHERTAEPDGERLESGPQ